MKLKKSILIVLSILLLGGCATKTNTIMPKKVSAATFSNYQKFTCEKLSSSFIYLERKASQIAGVQNEQAKSDAVLLSWGWIFYGVPYLFLDGNGAVKEEYEIITGKMQALDEIMVNKSCTANVNTL